MRLFETAMKTESGITRANPSSAASTIHTLGGKKTHLLLLAPGGGARSLQAERGKEGHD